MMEPRRMIAHHAIARVSWLRAAAIRLNFGIIALAGIVIGVAAAAVTEGEVLLAALAGTVAGAIGMGMAEYAIAAGKAEACRGGVAEADLPEADPDGLVVHRRFGPPDDLAGDAVRMGMGGGLGDYHSASPMQCGFTSAVTFATGAALPLAAASAFKLAAMPLGVGLISLAGSAVLAAFGARSVGLNPAHCMLRATSWGAGAMVAAFAVGRVFGSVVMQV